VTYGQRRALLVWDRILFPDGSSIKLDKMPATDTSGYAGLQGQVNSHPWQLIKGVVLSTALGLGSELSFGGGGAVARAIRESAQQNGSRAGDQLVGRSLDVQPTLTVPPGWPVRALLAKDLVLKPWKG
jgi:type IV secretion system protein VirB10